MSMVETLRVMCAEGSERKRTDIMEKMDGGSIWSASNDGSCREWQVR